MKSRIFGIVCSVVLAGALSTNKQVRVAESEAPDSTRNASREIAPPAEHPRQAWQKAEVVNPHSVDNKDQYEKR